MTTNIILSRLNLVPEIDENTPIVVLEEISICHRVPFVVSKHITVFLNDVRNKPIGTISNPIVNSDWTTIARYVNPNEHWSIQNLNTAYEFLSGWEGQRQLLPPRSFTFGAQIDTDPCRLNACLLYAMCKTNNIQTTRNTTMYQMATVCQMITRNISFTRSRIVNCINHMTIPNLIQTYLFIAPLVTQIIEPIGNVVEASPTFEGLEECFDQYDDKSAMRLQIHPRTYTDAIVLAALNFGVDISGAKNPIREYSILHQSPSHYIPEDPELLELVRMNPHQMDLSENFNPHLPSELYDNDALHNMVLREGFTEREIREESAHTLLQMALVSKTFYHGRQPGIRNEESPFLLEDIDELDNDLVVCYGIKGHDRSESILVAFRYSELGELFQGQRNFVNPLAQDEVFSDLAIIKLKNLCKRTRGSDTEDVVRERLMVHNAIINTELFTNASQAKAREFVVRYEQSDTTTQEQVRDAIYKLFLLSMYMRGWLGEGPYPIESAPVDDQFLTNHNVTQALIAFEQACLDLDGPPPLPPTPPYSPPLPPPSPPYDIGPSGENELAQAQLEIPEINLDDSDFDPDEIVIPSSPVESEFIEEIPGLGTMIMDLPLLKYTANEFHAINNPIRGRTIAERVAIVRAGDDHRNYDSCIRLSSNLFAVTSYRYMQILKMDPPFHIDRLRDIS
jgi:hypothetical protein